MKFPKRYYLTLLWTWQVDLVLWFLVIVFLRLFYGTKLHWEGLVLQCEINKSYLFKFGSFVAKGISLGHIAIYARGLTRQSGLDTKIEKHEHGHTEQWEGNMLFVTFVTITTVIVSMLLGVFGEFLYFIIPFWLLGGYGIYFARGLQALVRGEDFYKGNTDEESMYSQYKS